MTDRPRGASRPDPDPGDDPTRDIRLPPLGGRLAAQVPAAWAGTVADDDVHRHDSPVQEQPVDAVPPATASTPAVDPDPTIVVAPVGTSPEAAPLREEPTDEQRPAEAPRDSTRPFVPPSGQARQDAPGVAPPDEPRPENRGAAPRRPAEAHGGGAWTWVLLVLLPIVVIAAAGVLLFFVLSG